MQLQETFSADVKLDGDLCLQNGSLQYHLGVWLDRDTSTILSVKNVSRKGTSGPVHSHTALEDTG